MANPKINAGQKSQISQFQGITGASREQSIECLQASQWNVEHAINLFFNSGLTGGASSNNSAVQSLYDRYKDSQEDAILAEGELKSFQQNVIHSSSVSASDLSCFGNLV